VLGEDRFYILTPLDIILASKRDDSDHIEWLQLQDQFEEAMQFAENPKVAKALPPGMLQEIGIKYIHHLINTGKYAEAAKKCHEKLGPDDKSRWEGAVMCFMREGQLPVILPFIPISEPKLSPVAYELVLNSFLQTDCKLLYKVLETWPTSVYNAKAILCAVEEVLKRKPGDGDVLKVKALL